MYYKVIKDHNGTLWASDYEKLSNQDINNMILVLQNPELIKMFTNIELKMIKMAIKTYIIEKAYSTLYEVTDEQKDELEKESHSGKTLKKEYK